MTTQLAFAFGMLVMIGAIGIATIVIGMVKVIKLQKQTQDLNQSVGREIELLHRHGSDTERAVFSEVNETRRKFDEYTENLRRELQAYTDSRIDKALGTTKKEILKD